MRIAVPHHTTRAAARQIVEQRLGQLLGELGHKADEAQHEWTGDILQFRGKARGLSVSGTVEITDSEVIIDGSLPLLAKPFEPRIRQTVEREAEQMFRRA
jgi:hypothetical protein